LVIVILKKHDFATFFIHVYAEPTLTLRRENTVTSSKPTSATHWSHECHFQSTGSPQRHHRLINFWYSTYTTPNFAAPRASVHDWKQERVGPSSTPSNKSGAGGERPSPRSRVVSNPLSASLLGGDSYDLRGPAIMESTQGRAPAAKGVHEHLFVHRGYHRRT